MDILNLISFFLPVHLSPFKVELLPIIFFILIWGLFAWTIWSVKQSANVHNWTNNWYGGNRNNKSMMLDVEHGSVMEISAAVATSAEKRADIMPGIILIVGLLGTFLGLGLALDKASSILSNASNAQNMDASMVQLMKMLEGLGAKFKTSTWGLLAFLGLKVVLDKDGYEDRRLRWAIEKVKMEFDKIREEQRFQDEQKNEKIIDTMTAMQTYFAQMAHGHHSINQTQLKQIEGHHITMINGFKSFGEFYLEQFKQGKENNNRQLTELIASNQSILTTLIENSNAQISALKEEFSGQANLLRQTSNHMLEQGVAQQSILLESISFIHEILEKQHQNLMSNLENQHSTFINSVKQWTEEHKNMFMQQMNDIKPILNTITDGMNHIGKNITETLKENNTHSHNMQQTLKQQAEEMQQHFNALKSSLDKVPQTISDMSKKTSQQLENLITQNKKVSGAMAQFIEKNESMVDKLGESARNMANAATTMGTSATAIGQSASELQNVIDSFRQNMEDVVSLMKQDLNTTIEGMNTSFSQNMDKMTRNLETSIQDMSGNFKENMTEMSEGLGKATHDISNAVNSLSVNVEDTMKEVTETIDTSMTLQTNAQVKFVETSDNLNENILEMTSLVDKLKGDITGGLKAVSESNRNMISLAKQTEHLAVAVDESFNKFLSEISGIKDITNLSPQLSTIINETIENRNIINTLAKNKMIPELESMNKQLTRIVEETDKSSKTVDSLITEITGQKEILKAIKENTQQIKN